MGTLTENSSKRVDRGTDNRGIRRKTFKIPWDIYWYNIVPEAFAQLVWNAHLEKEFSTIAQEKAGENTRDVLSKNYFHIKGNLKIDSKKLPYFTIAIAPSDGFRRISQGKVDIRIPFVEEARSREIQKDKEEKDVRDRKVQSLEHYINMTAHFIQEEIKMMKKGNVFIEYKDKKFIWKADTEQKKGSFSYLIRDEKMNKAELDLIKKSLWDAESSYFKYSEITISNLEEELDQVNEAFDIFLEKSDDDSVDYLELMKDLFLPTKEDLLLLLLGGGFIKVFKSGYKLFRWIKRSKKVSSAITKATRAARKIYTKLLKQNKLKEMFKMTSDIMSLSYIIFLRFIRDKKLIKKTFHEIISNTLAEKSSNMSNTAGKVFSKEVIGEMLNQHFAFAKPNKDQEKNLIKAGFALFLFKPEISIKLAQGFINQSFIYRSVQNTLTLYQPKISNIESIAINEKDIKTLAKSTIKDVLIDVLKIFVGDSKDIPTKLFEETLTVAMKTWAK